MGCQELILLTFVYRRKKKRVMGILRKVYISLSESNLGFGRRFRSLNGAVIYIRCGLDPWNLGISLHQ